MKYLWTIAIVALLAGCTTPGKIIASSSITADKAMQSWSVYVVDGKATLEQQAKVKELQARYYAAEDAALDAYLVFVKTDDESAWLKARVYLNEQRENLVKLITVLTGETP